MSSLPAIDWAEALVQVGNDTEFLKEMLETILQETDEAEQSMAVAIEQKNLFNVKQVAHKVKGSAASLCCRRLEHLCCDLQNYCLAKLPCTVADFPTDYVQEQFDEFKAAVSELKDVAARYVAEGK